MPPLSYEEWKKRYAAHDSGKDYDLVGAWQAGLVPSANQHFPDTFKFPNHPTFSTESKFYYPGIPAGRWEGENYIPMSAPMAAEWVKQHGQNLAPPNNLRPPPLAAPPPRGGLGFMPGENAPPPRTWLDGDLQTGIPIIDRPIK